MSDLFFLLKGKSASRSRLESLKKFAAKAKEIGDTEAFESIKKALKRDFDYDNINLGISYSQVMRKLNKDNDKERLENFMKCFKETFDQADNESLDEPDKVALIESLQAIKWNNDDAKNV